MADPKRSVSQVYEQIQAGVEKDIQDSTGAPAPGGLIAALIAFLMQMLGGFCPIPPVPADINTENLRREIAIDRGLLATNVRPRSQLGQATLASMKTHMNKITDAEATDIIAQA